MKNWGEKAQNLECRAEVLVYDPISPWKCYIYAMNPDDEDEIECIVAGFGLETTTWSLKELFSRFNSHGESVQVDHEFRPMHAATLLKELKDKEYYEFYRD